MKSPRLPSLLFTLTALSFSSLAHSSVVINSLDIAFNGINFNGSLHIKLDGAEVASGETNHALDSYVTAFTTTGGSSEFSFTGDILWPPLQ